MTVADDGDPEDADDGAPSGRRGFLKVLGPGLITGASDDDPSGIATYSQAGAQFGYALSWTLLFSFPLMSAAQMISARIGRTTGHGIAGVLRLHYPNWLLQSIVVLLFVANTINLGADLGAMADAVGLLVPGAAPARHPDLCGPVHLYAGLPAVPSLRHGAEMADPGAVRLFRGADRDQGRLGPAAPPAHRPRDWLGPGRPDDHRRRAGDDHQPLSLLLAIGRGGGGYRGLSSPERLPRPRNREKRPLHRIEIDTLVGMAFSNLVALAIMVTAAANLHAHGIGDIQTSAQAAEALRPVAGSFAFWVFTLGIVGTGMLAVPVLAGSAAYALGEARRWPIGFARQWRDAKAFYGTVALATLVGMGINFTGINPIRALFWSAVINGVLAVPVMATMMLMSARADIMGAFAVGGGLRILGWISTGVMALAVIGMFVTMV